MGTGGKHIAASFLHVTTYEHDTLSRPITRKFSDGGCIAKYNRCCIGLHVEFCNSVRLANPSYNDIPKIVFSHSNPPLPTTTCPLPCSFLLAATAIPRPSRNRIVITQAQQAIATDSVHGHRSRIEIGIILLCAIGQHDAIYQDLRVSTEKRCTCAC